MPDIKTKDIAKGTIKTIDKSAVAAERMKSAFIQTKEKAEHSVSVPESSAEEYASNRLESGIDRVSHEAVHQFDKQGRKGVQATKQNIVKAKDGIQKFKEKRAAQSLQKQAAGTVRNKGVKVAEQMQKTVKESARSAGKKTIKTVGKGSAKTAQKTVKPQSAPLKRPSRQHSVPQRRRRKQRRLRSRLLKGQFRRHGRLQRRQSLRRKQSQKR